MRHLTGALAGAGIMLASTGAPAAAAVNPYTPSAVCGTAYSVAAYSEPIVADGDAVPAGTLHLRYNPILGGYCAVAIKSRWVGVATHTSVGLFTGTGTPTEVQGSRLYYGGPVYRLPASDGCILYGASITSPTGTVYYHASVNPAIGYARYCR